MKYKYFFLLKSKDGDREVVFYGNSRVDAEKDFEETFGVRPLATAFLRRENS